MRIRLGSRRPRSALLLIAALALAGCDEIDELLSSKSAVPDAGVAVPKPVAHIIEVRGAVRLERGPVAAPAQLEDLYIRDAIETGADGETRIQFSGGRVIEVSHDTRFIIGQDATGLVLEVVRGLVLSRVPADGPATDEPVVALSILTPYGLTRVGSGQSEVAFEVGAGGAKVNVRVGAIEFVSRNGQAMRAGEGDTLSLTAGDVQFLGKQPDIVLEPIQVTVLANTGRAELKKKDSKKWQAISRQGDALGEGDSVRVRDGRSTLRLAGSQSSLGLERGGEITFEKGQRAGEVEEARLDLKKGDMMLNLAPRKKSRLVLAGLQLETDVGGQFGISKTRDGFQVNALTGDLRLRREGMEQLLQAGQVAHVGKGGLPEIDEIEKSEVTLPPRSGIKLFHSGLPDIALGWEGGPGDYFVEVASDPSFTQPFASGLVHAPSINVPAPRKGALFWRVTRPDGKTEVAKGSASFSPEPLFKDLARLRNEVPEGTEKTTIFYQDKPPAVTFTYKPEAKAAKYRVTVFNQEQLDRPVAERLVTQNSALLEAGVLSEGSYVWSVTPLSATGEELRGGKMSKLELVYDNSVPSLVITSPKNGDVASAPLRATGVAPVGTRLYINGKPAPLDEKNRFDAPAVPIGRPPVVIFRLSRPPAADSYTVRVLRRGR